jgi:hypothetical protein
MWLVLVPSPVPVPVAAAVHVCLPLPWRVSLRWPKKAQAIPDPHHRFQSHSPHGVRALFDVLVGRVSGREEDWEESADATTTEQTHEWTPGQGHMDTWTWTCT